MKKKTYMLSLALVMTLGLVAFISGFAGRSAASQSSTALSALPTSDIVVTVDTQRFLSEALPTILAEQPALMAKVNSQIEQFNKELGIDLRTFDSVAVGLRFNGKSTDDFDGVVIARGHFNSSQVLDAAFAAAAKKKGEFQKTEEVYEGKTIFVLSSSQRRVTKPAPNTNANVDSSQVQIIPEVEVKATLKAEGTANRNSDQMAVVALDGNTLAVGELKGVRAAIDASLGRGRVDDELVRMAMQNSSALVGFSGKIPATVAEKMAGGNKGAKYAASIREFYGSFSAVGTDMETFVAVRTEKPSDAKDIGQALNALKLFSGFGIGQVAPGEAASIANLLKGLSITTQDNEVQIKLNIKQKDLAPFVKKF